MQEKLGLQDSKNTFALYKQNSVWEQPVCGSALIADVLYRLVQSAGSVSHSVIQLVKQNRPPPNPPAQEVRHNKQLGRRAINSLSESGRDLSRL